MKYMDFIVRTKKHNSLSVLSSMAHFEEEKQRLRETDLTMYPFILDFTSTLPTADQVPAWLRRKQMYRVLLGEGDTPDMLNKNITDLYDIFVCYPYCDVSYPTYFLELIASIHKAYPTGETGFLICMLDIQNKIQVQHFVTLFTNQCILIHTTPHGVALPDYEIASTLLCDHGYYRDSTGIVPYVMTLPEQLGPEWLLTQPVVTETIKIQPSVPFVQYADDDQKKEWRQNILDTVRELATRHTEIFTQSVLDPILDELLGLSDEQLTVSITGLLSLYYTMKWVAYNATDLPPSLKIRIVYQPQYRKTPGKTRFIQLHFVKQSSVSGSKRKNPSPSNESSLKQQVRRTIIRGSHDVTSK